MSKSILFIIFSLSLTACATHSNNPIDPLEPMNRSIYSFNKKMDSAIAEPVAKGYHAITPQFFRTGVGNFFGNILDMYSVLNNALSLDVERTISDIMRVAINSTFGLFGLIDFATPAGLKGNKTGLGDTFAHWGWEQSRYLVLPLLGPSTIRDGLGKGIELYFSPDRQIYSTPTEANAAWTLGLINQRARLLGVEDILNEAALDPYTYTRDAYLQLRSREINLRIGRENISPDLLEDSVGPSPEP